TDHVYPRMRRGVLCTAIGRQQIDARSVPAQLCGDQFRARFVLFAWRIDGRDADQARRKVDDFVCGAIDLSKNGVAHGAACRVPVCQGMCRVPSAKVGAQYKTTARGTTLSGCTRAPTLAPGTLALGTIVLG